MTDLRSVLVRQSLCVASQPENESVRCEHMFAVVKRLAHTHTNTFRFSGPMSMHQELFSASLLYFLSLNHISRARARGWRVHFSMEIMVSHAERERERERDSHLMNRDDALLCVPCEPQRARVDIVKACHHFRYYKYTQEKKEGGGVILIIHTHENL